MKRIFGVVLVVSCLMSLLSGCVSDSAQQITQSTEETIPTTPLCYTYQDLDFSLSFPEIWSGRFSVQQDGNCVTVNIDGTPLFSFASLQNEPDMKKHELKLLEDGYTYYLHNGTHFFYYKILGVVPKELCDSYSRERTTEWHTEKVMYTCWQINCETKVCSVLIEEDAYYLAMKQNDYINHRMGIAVTLPEAMLNHGAVYLKLSKSFQNDGLIELVLQEPDEYDYLLCSIFALSVSDPLHGHSDFNIAYSPELVFRDGKLYGAVNEWRDSGWRTGTYSFYGWERYPDHIRSTFSFEEVQKVVDSFRIL